MSDLTTLLLAEAGLVVHKDYDESQHPRDDHGRWAEGGGGGAGSAASATTARTATAVTTATAAHPAFQFYSPNEKEQMDFEEAYRNLASDDQQRFVEIGKDVDKHVGLDAHPMNAIGDWADGAENSVFNVITNAPSFDAVAYSAAVKGDIANQKAVIPFLVGEGNDSVYRFHLDQDVRAVRQTLDQAGIQYRTLIPAAKGVDIAVFDPGSGLGDKMEALAEKYGTDIERQRGRGEFLGGDTRDEGHQAYARVIQDWEGTHGRYNRPEPGQRVPVSRSQKADAEEEVDSNGIRGPAGQALFAQVLKRELDAGASDTRAHITAFKALRDADYAHESGVWVHKDYDEDQHPRDDHGRWTFGGGGGGGGGTSGGGAPADYKESDVPRYDALKNKLAQVNNDLLPYLGHPDAPEVQAKMDEMKGIVKEIHSLHADPGGVEGIGLPGGARDLVIVGAGPGGLASSIMGAADGLDTLLVEANAVPGGQSKYSSRIENYPGFPMGVTGSQLAQTSFEQATRLGVEPKMGVRVTGLSYDPQTELKTLTLSNGETVQSRAVVIAGGVEFKKLDFPGSDSKSVIYADGQTLAEKGRDKPVVVMGGSNAAAQAALGAARTASKVYILSRSPLEKGMSEYQVRAVKNNPKIEIIENDQLAKLSTDEHGDAQRLTTAGGKDIECKALGIFVGSAPKTDWLPAQIQRSKDGKVAVNSDFETAIPGVYAVGDIREGSIGRVGAAVGEGQMAERNVFQYFDKVKQRQAVAVGKREVLTDGDFNQLIDRFFALDKENPYIGQFYEPEVVPVIQKADANGIVGPQGQEIFESVLKRELHGGHSEVRAHIAAFKALQECGYVHEGGVWLSKAEPAVGDVHVNRPMGAVKYTGDEEDTPGKKKRKKDRAKDDPGGQDVSLREGKEKDDPGSQDVSPMEGGSKLALPLPKYQSNQFNNAHKIAKRISGSSDIALSPKGRELVTALGKRLHLRGGLDVLHSSTLPRATETAQRIAQECPGTKLAASSPELVPWHLGGYEGRMPGDVKDFIAAYIEHPDERPPGKGADDTKAETFHEAATRQLNYLKGQHDDWQETDPSMKIGDVMHSRGLELLQAYVDAGAPDVDEFLKSVDPKDLVTPDDPDHNALLLWKKNKIKELDPSDDDPLEAGHYLILHGLTHDDTDEGNAEELDKSDSEARLFFQPPLEVRACAQQAYGQDQIVDGVTDLLAVGVGLAEVGIRKVADFFDNAEPAMINAWGGPGARKWANKILGKLAKNNGYNPWVGVDLDNTMAEPVESDDPLVIGAPRPGMIEHVKDLMQQGKLVKIFTARVAHDPGGKIRRAIQKWSKQHVGAALEVTNEKDPGMTGMVDDLAQRPEEVAKQGSGVMLAFWPDPETQKQLAVEGGEPADSLHVTLAYFGKPGDLNMENLPVLELMLANFAATHGPVNGTLSGLGRFPATPQSDGQDVIYLGVHLDGVQQFRRELVEATKLAGFTPKDNFGFNPHLTLNFVSPHAPHLMATPDPVPVTFGKVVLTNGADRTEFPLTGEDEDRGELEYTKFEIEGTIVKADEDKKQVFGWFSVISIDGKSITDTQGDLITADTLEAAAYDYVLETRKGGEMHETTKGDVRQVGRLIESCVFTREKQKAMQESLRGQDIHATLDLGSVGWWGGFQIDDSGTWKNIKNGQLRAFSIGGKGKRQKLD